MTMDLDIKKKFKIVTLGCRTNQYESQAYRDQLLELGYQEVQENDPAEICIVNTCTVTESADSSSRHAIRQLARENPGSQLLVTGCFAERQPETVRQIPGVTHVVPNNEKEVLLAKLFPEETLPEFSIKNFESHTRAFLKVQDGCNSFCTYCIIPYVRGRSRSKKMDEILSEATSLIASGFKEIVITGINVGDFDGGVSKEEEPVSLAELVRQMDQLPGLERLRVSSIDPDEVDDNLLNAILNGRTTCHSMHVVLQSGSNVILKRMNRKYTRQIFLDTVEKLRAHSSDFTFTTDIIVGFPGETEADFNDTLDVMEKVKFAKVHMFPYSDRPRTRSALMPNKVPVDTIKARKQEVIQRAEKYSYALRQNYVGRKMWVLTESREAEQPDWISGHTENFLLVSIQSAQLSSNEMVEVELIENTPQGLIGRLL